MAEEKIFINLTKFSAYQYRAALEVDGNWIGECFSTSPSDAKENAKKMALVKYPDATIYFLDTIEGSQAYIESKKGPA